MRERCVQGLCAGVTGAPENFRGGLRAECLRTECLRSEYMHAESLHRHDDGSPGFTRGTNTRRSGA